MEQRKPRGDAAAGKRREKAGSDVETREWLESLDGILRDGGPERARELLIALERRAADAGVTLPYRANTPYVNTIPRSRQPRYPGDLELERRVRRLVRWNAMAMVVRANRASEGIGGHISTFASQATLLRVAFYPFFPGPDAEDGGGRSGDGPFGRAGSRGGRAPAAHIHPDGRPLARGYLSTRGRSTRRVSH